MRSFLFLMVVASAAGEEANPVAKVITMIGDLQGKIIAEGEESQQVYEEFAEFCEDRSKELSQKTKSAKDMVDLMEATIQKETADSMKMNRQIEELTGRIAQDEKELKSATEMRKAEASEFETSEKEFTETISALERAILVLDKEMEGGSALLQLQGAQSLTKALAVLVQAASISSADASRLSALTQVSSESDDDDSDAALAAQTVAAPYENKSEGIVEVLDNLLEKARTQLEDVRKNEVAAGHNFELQKQSLEQSLKLAQEDFAEAKKNLAASGEAKASAEGSVSATKSDLSADTKTLADLHSNCMTKAADFESETRSRGEELKALDMAKKVLAKVVGGESFAQSGQPYFLQIRDTSDSTAHKVVKLVRTLGKRQQSEALMQLASRISSAFRLGHMGGEDPFKNVKELIVGMISKLEKKAAEAATKKEYCDKELAQTAEKKDDKSDRIDRLDAKINSGSVKIAKLKQEVSDLQGQLSEISSAQVEMDKLRAEEKQAYGKYVPELQKGMDGIKKAMKILRDYYASDDKRHADSESSTGAIFALLEGTEVKLIQELAQLKSGEETAIEEYKTATKENEVDRAAKQKDVEYKEKEATSLEQSVGDQQSDREGLQTELEAVLQYDTKIKDECIAEAESYAERKDRREAEIAGLEEAIDFLDAQAAALIQLRTKHRREQIKRHGKLFLAAASRGTFRAS
eukprot:gnl/TRDRNA2_/TRDRNA2_176542_c2_seq14.p1 gnl/TRDRNA2_/TRDRNA2_176542_c2~~gnl/TRDRNA2_/TRDRNA2_176542_c2_seq14.p1  ORF type:complete len:695 (-),score=219.10 gnl/TRDRNA2_/TRDRNA2_176542_c2_seq14:30-2114(-)